MLSVLSILFCLSLLYLSVTSRVKAFVSVLRFQGVLLTVMIFMQFIDHASIFALILPLTLFVVKVILVPRYINKIILSINIQRMVKPSIQNFTFLLLVLLSMGVIFAVTHFLAQTTEIDTIPFASGFSAVVTGMFIIITQKKLIIHVAGFLVLENGIFLFGTSVASQLPIIIEIGSLLDVFVVVFLMGIAINRISSTLSEVDITALKRLKD